MGPEQPDAYSGVEYRELVELYFSHIRKGYYISIYAHVERIITITSKIHNLQSSSYPIFRSNPFGSMRPIIMSQFEAVASVFDTKVA